MCEWGVTSQQHCVDWLLSKEPASFSECTCEGMLMCDALLFSELHFVSFPVGIYQTEQIVVFDWLLSDTQSQNTALEAASKQTRQTGRDTTSWHINWTLLLFTDIKLTQVDLIPPLLVHSHGVFRTLQLHPLIKLVNITGTLTRGPLLSERQPESVPL